MFETTDIRTNIIKKSEEGMADFMCWHCICWCPGTYRWQDISRHCDDQVWVHQKLVLNGLTYWGFHTNGPTFCRQHFQRLFFLNEKCCILIQISLKCVSKGANDSKSVMVQIMAWHWTGKKPFIWTNDGLLHWCITASLGLNESTHLPLMPHICVSELGQRWFR